MRIDKWLWAARFFKTRGLAARSCELGRIHANGLPAKPSRDIRAGDKLQIKNESGEFHIEVLALGTLRGPAGLAQTLYHETDASRELRLQQVAERKAAMQAEGSRDGRPSKRDRRVIGRVRGFLT